MQGQPVLQNPPPGGRAAQAMARGWVWTRLGWTAGDAGVRRVRLARSHSDAPDLDTLLEPFDHIRDLDVPRRARHVSRGWLQAWVASWPTLAWPALPMAAPVDLPVAVLAHQLSPTLAMVRGLSARLLLADPVGQGKTIEAGLLLRELAARGAADRVLVITPLTLRDQWRAELHARCGLAAEAIDRVALRVRERHAPPDIGPFQPPGLTLLSIDLAKQPDVLARLVRVCWDVLVIDEAHGVSGDSARAAAAAALGARARLVLLLTATPHAGDTAAFNRLCAIGRLGASAPLVAFRRQPVRDARQLPRHRDVSARRSAAERVLASALGAYVRQLDRTREPAARLIAMVLRKRGLSSPAALAASLRHRMEWLACHDQPVEQPSLPFDDEDVDAGDDRQPAVMRERGLTDVRAETALLAAAHTAAEHAARQWTKLGALRRLLRRTRERMLVFTEYRDTLTALSAALAAETSVATLHGGLTAGARASALAQFTAGQARVLVATDVAAEGLNLQHACRLVVHVELPWSPARLEQRNGRVDRLGQPRRVHVWRLLGDLRHESRVLAGLSARVARMRADGIDLAAWGIPARPEPLDPPDLGTGAWQHAAADDSQEVAEQLARIRRVLAICARRPSPGPAAIRAGLPWVRARRWPGGLPRGVTVVCLLPASARGSRPVLLPVHVALTGRPPGSPSRWLAHMARSAVEALAGHAPSQPLTDTLRARERALLDNALEQQARAAVRWQGSLFERRTAHIVAAAHAGTSRRIEEHQQRLTELGATHDAPAAVAVLVLLVD